MSISITSAPFGVTKNGEAVTRWTLSNAAGMEGCPFRPRCSCAMDECDTHCPALRELEPGHRAACCAI